LDEVIFTVANDVYVVAVSRECRRSTVDAFNGFRLDLATPQH
jgi:hypothetical protein